jgi:hypothetical protein
MKPLAHRTALAVAPIVLIALACGQSPNRTSYASLEAPNSREARIALIPALDTTQLTDPALETRLSLDEIEVNVGDLRLLGPDPRIPTGGLPLIQNPHLVSAGDGSGRFPIPASLLHDSLAAYVRIDTTQQLNGASVVIHGRLFKAAVHKRQALVSIEDPSSPGPDGEPSMGTSGLASPGPDGEPSRPLNGGGTQSPGPDGEPSRCPEGYGQIRCTHNWLSSTPNNPAVEFELRGTDVAELLVDFGSTGQLDVTLGIPAARWLTPDVVSQLEIALANAAAIAQPGSSTMNATSPGTVVVSATQDARVVSLSNDPTRTDSFRADSSGAAYRLIQGDPGAGY